MDLLPRWISDIASLLAVLIGTPSIILFFLGRKDANRKLHVDEGGLSVQVFDSQLRGYQTLLSEQRIETAKEAGKVSDLQGKMSEMKTELDTVWDLANRIWDLLSKIVNRADIELSKDEYAELEATRPRRAVPKKASRQASK